MTDTPTLTDPAALAFQRKRATDMFLQEQARDEIEDRLSMVNRRFTSPVVVTGFPKVWCDSVANLALCPESEVLELKTGAHDLLIHGLGMHWANDPLGQLIQCRRALKPDGFFLGVLLGGQTLHELRSALAEAESGLRGGLSPRVAPMAEIRELGGLLQRAGLALPVADSVRLTTSYETPLHLMRDLRAMGEANALAARSRQFLRRDVLYAAVQKYSQAYALEDGRIPATFELIILSGWAPDPTQPQPLAPGSATNRLADALGIQETPLND